MRTLAVLFAGVSAAAAAIVLPARDPAPGPVVLIGDSILQQWTLPGAVNLARSGAPSGAIIDQARRVPRDASVVVVNGGTNDVLNLATADTVRNVRAALAALPADSLVVAVGITPVHEPALTYKLSDMRNADISRLNSDIRAVCAARVRCTFAHPFESGALRHDEHSGDGVHLSGVGYVRLREAVCRAAPQICVRAAVAR